VDALIRGLGLPRRLSEVSDRTPEDLAALAPLVMELRHVAQNPRRLESEAEARDLLARMY
jgi:alcohol dehydrogenase class IV